MGTQMSIPKSISAAANGGSNSLIGRSCARRLCLVFAIRFCILGAAIVAALAPAHADSRLDRCGWNAVFQFVARNEIDPPLASRLYAAFAIGSDAIYRHAALKFGSEEAARIAPDLYLRLAQEQTSRALLWAPYPILAASCAIGGPEVKPDMLVVLKDVARVLDRLWKRNGGGFGLPSPSGQWHPNRGTDPLRPDWGNVRPLLIGDAEKFQSKNPVAYGSLDRQAELVWNAVSNLSPAERAQVLYWADGIGTFTPPGHWAQIALDGLEASDLDLGQKLFIVGATMVAVNDAVIACWRDKYTFGVPRPSQVYSKINPVIPNPNFPSYPSGHSVISTAASHVLASYLPKRAATLELMAQQAGHSRFLAGIHYLADIEAGIVQGKGVAIEVVRKLDPERSLINQLELP